MIFFRNIILIVALFTLEPASAKGLKKAETTRTTPISSIIQPQPLPTKPIIPQPTIQPQPTQPVQKPTQASQNRSNEWLSSAGLVYKSNKNFPNRINHVLEHAKPNPNKPTHSVFSVPENAILDLIDEAWRNRDLPKTDLKPDTYIIDMGRTIGTKGQSKIKIIVSAGTSDIITAHPTQ